MKTFATILIGSTLILAGTTSRADDASKKSDGMMKKGMTMQECKAHMADSKGMKKEDMPKVDAMCDDMLKKDEATKKIEPMKKDAPPSAPATK